MVQAIEFAVRDSAGGLVRGTVGGEISFKSALVRKSRLTCRGRALSPMKKQATTW
jgi:hypothetical protein